MKKYMLILSICLFSSTSFSNTESWFYQPMNCYITGSFANCVTTNYRFQAAFCKAEAHAKTFTGNTVSNYFEGWIESRKSIAINLTIDEDSNDVITNVHAVAKCLL